jgi:hypothetical protein
VDAVFIVGTVNILSLSGSSPVIQGTEKSDRGKSRCDEVRIGLIHQYRPPIRPPRNATDPAQPLKRTTVTRHEIVRTGLPLLRDTEHDDLRIDFLQVEAEGLQNRQLGSSQ